MGTLGRIPVRQLVALMVGAAAAIAIAAGAWMWTQAADYKVLYSNLSDRDGGAIIAALNQMAIPYKFSEGGSAILVPSGQVHDARLRIASQGLPKGSVVGFELVDNQKFGTTQFQEQVNYQRGLEGELAKSIQSLSAVQSARVHLAIPKPSVFVRDQQAPSASVLVTLHPAKTLTREQVTGILNLVASSVPELTPKNVSVLSQNGDLLSANGTGADAGGLDATQLSYAQQIEQSTNQRIMDILEPIVGRGNARVQVSADINFARVEAVAETFKPNQDPKGASVRQQQSTQATTTGAAPGVQGVPGALSNQPPPAGTAPLDPAKAAAQAAGGAPSSNRKDESVAYEVDKTIQHTRSPVGNIKRMTAAVLLNHRKLTDDAGTVTMTPLKPEEMEQINALVREAMGFSKERGDSLNIVNTPFNVTEQEAVPEVPFWRSPDTIATAKDVGRYALLVALIGYLYFGQLKPLLNKAMIPAPIQREDFAIERERERLASERTETGELLTDARRIAREDPKVVASVVRSWVTPNG